MPPLPLTIPFSDRPLPSSKFFFTLSLELDGTFLASAGSQIPQELKKINEQYALDFNCSSLYQLEEETLEKDLNDSLENGDLYKFDFNYYSDFNVETGILMKNEFGYFALIGKETHIPWIDKGEAMGECFETPEVEEIDFEML